VEREVEEINGLSTPNLRERESRKTSSLKYSGFSLAISYIYGPLKPAIVVHTIESSSIR
jgi:hypothetical protein